MSQPIKILSPIRLKDFNPDYHEGLDKDETREKTERLCQRIGELQEVLHAEGRRSVLIVLQGMDTSGKDGVARRVLSAVNPAGVETANFGVPSAEELAHDFLWRIHKALPRRGQIGVFNRSHYEDVLVVRVLRLQPVHVWRARYDQINAFERHLTANGVVILKFFLHISRAEQAERLKARLADPRKNWKFQPDDLKMRAHWSKFQTAYQDAINHCTTHDAPWHVVPANRKWYRDYVVARTVAQAMQGMKLAWPKLHPDFASFKIE
jgi:PPK2 family polyphosphate:nucleotide phosphotransferase